MRLCQEIITTYNPKRLGGLHGDMCGRKAKYKVWIETAVRSFPEQYVCGIHWRQWLANDLDTSWRRLEPAEVRGENER
jgi:hypothetical protein